MKPPVLLLACWVVSAACASRRAGSIYVHPNADFATYSSIAVLPLDNLTSDRFAGDRVREILMIELSAQGMFEVAEIGEVNRVLRVQNLPRVTELGPEQVAALGRELGSQALMAGSVMSFKERQVGTVISPEVSLSLRLIDVETGIVVWSATDAKAGMGFWTRFFGVGEETQSEAASQLVRDLIDTIY